MAKQISEGRKTWRSKTEFSPSRTIPGQSLMPSELLKRHLAGTLPEIDQKKNYEYHYDESGEKIGEPLPIEMHEFHALAVALRKRQFEEATKKRAEQAQKFKDQIIEEWKKQNPDKVPAPEPQPPVNPES